MSERRTCAPGICQPICNADVFDETFGVNRAFNAEVFVTVPHESRWSSICSRRGGVLMHRDWVKDGGVSKGKVR
jgi:hypothetical protein